MEKHRTSCAAEGGLAAGLTPGGVPGHTLRRHRRQRGESGEEKCARVPFWVVERGRTRSALAERQAEEVR